MENLKYSKISLIGMPGVGKTTFGKLLASNFKYEFIDIDELIIKKINSSITKFLKNNSEKKFIALEENIILNIKFPEKCIISTGGSVIYSEKSMNYLKNHSKILFLSDEINNIKKRIKDYNTRGIITQNHTSIEDLYKSRLSLYKKYQDITVVLPSPLSIKNGLETIVKNLT